MELSIGLYGFMRVNMLQISTINISWTSLFCNLIGNAYYVVWNPSQYEFMHHTWILVESNLCLHELPSPVWTWRRRICSRNRTWWSSRMHSDLCSPTVFCPMHVFKYMHWTYIQRSRMSVKSPGIWEPRSIQSKKTFHLIICFCRRSCISNVYNLISFWQVRFALLRLLKGGGMVQNWREWSHLQHPVHPLWQCANALPLFI